MRSIWLEDNELHLRDDVPIPNPVVGEALVRVLRAGICNTDLEMVRGYYPYTGTLGHEFVGRVEKGPEALLGQRVVGEINAVCGDCSNCVNGLSNHCDNRTVLGIHGRDGAFAEYLTLPVDNLHLVPDEVSTDAASFTEPLAAALQIQQQVKFSPDDRVIVVGDGKLGQLVAQTLALTGCDLLAVGRYQSKLDLLSQRGIRTASEDALESHSYDLAVECSGNSGGFALARSLLRPRGTLVMKSTYADELTFDASEAVVDEISIIGSRCGPFKPALRLLAERQVEVEPLIHARYPLTDGLAACECAKHHGVLKVLMEMCSE